MLLFVVNYILGMKYGYFAGQYALRNEAGHPAEICVNGVSIEYKKKKRE